MSRIQHDSGIGVNGIVSRSIDVVTDRPLIVGIAMVGTFLGQLPYVGWLLALFATMGVTLLADRELGDWTTAGHSLPIRVLSVIAALAVVWGPAVVVALLAIGILGVIGLLLVVAPLVYLWLRTALVVPATVADGYGPIDGLRESWDRTETNLGVVLVFSLLIAIPSAAVQVGAELVGTLLPGPFAAVAVIGVFLGLLAAVGTTGNVVMYRRF